MSKKLKSIISICLCLLLSVPILITLCACDTQEKVLTSMYPIEYENLVIKNHYKYDVDESLIYAVIKTESGFDPDAVSSANACGLMQITPDTFDWLQFKKGIDDKMNSSYLFNPAINIEYGTYFLSILLDRYDDVEVAISAYNAGISAVDGWLDNEDHSSDGKTLDTIPYQQTDQYVVKVIKSQQTYKKLYNIN